MSADLPPPSIPDYVDLRKLRKMPLDVVRLRSADMHAEVTAEEGWYALQLWAASFHQVPASSLPDDEAKLAHLAGLGRDKRTWKRVRQGAMRGFVKCSDGRLYHAVMSELCLEVWTTYEGKRRGAKITNEGRKNTHPIDNAENPSRIAPRSIYSERNGQRPDSETLSERSPGATEGKSISSPLTPPLGSTAGSVGCAGAPPPRPAMTAQQVPEFVHAELPSGAKIRISEFGQVDVTWTPLDCGTVALTRQQALDIRAQVLAETTGALA